MSEMIAYVQSNVDLLIFKPREVNDISLAPNVNRVEIYGLLLHFLLC